MLLDLTINYLVTYVLFSFKYLISKKVRPVSYFFITLIFTVTVLVTI